VLLLGVACVVGAGVWAAIRELTTFEYQARWLASIAGEIGYRVEGGASDSVTFPLTGETDHRLGYIQLPRSLERLQAAGYQIESQARWSPRLGEVVELGLNAPYHRKDAPGLVLTDRFGIPIHRGTLAERSYPTFDDIPKVVVDTLLFIENRELLKPGHPKRNPAVEWDRLAHSVAIKAMSLAGSAQKTPGASTLATQLEKYHHSPGGLTDSAREKLRQMA
jgi:membrane peptidoglycan carboxypeptidase